MDEEEEMKKFEMEGNGEKEEKENTLDKEALCERLMIFLCCNSQRAESILC